MRDYEYIIDAHICRSGIEKHNVRYHSFLYCHTMKDENHLLNKKVPKLIKSLSRHPLCNMENVVGAIQFEIASRMFYVFHDFHKVAHGTCSSSMWDELIRVRSVWCNEGKGIKTHTITQNSVKDISQKYVKVYYPGSVAVQAFESIQISHLQWLKLILQFGVSDEKRDVKNNNYGITKRVMFGWTQKQSVDLRNTFVYKNKSKPHASFPHWLSKDILNKQLKTELGKIMHLSQLLVDDLERDTKVMNNWERTLEFGYVLGKCFWENSSSRFEFITIIAEKDCTISRHLDYQNSKEKYYNVGCSYSFLYQKENDMYRVNFVLCNRRQVDSFFEEIVKN